MKDENRMPGRPDNKDDAHACPHCRLPMHPGTSLVECRDCGAVHHVECWNENQGCTTFGCKGSANTTASPRDTLFRPSLDETKLFLKIIKSGDLQQAKRMLDAFPNSGLVNAQLEGQTPLQQAAMFGLLETAKFLIAHGARVNELCIGSSSALHWAAMTGHEDVVELLIASGAQVDVTIPGCYTALHLAAVNGALGATRVLVSCGADPNARRDNDMVPLHYAASMGHINIVKLLIENGAEVNLRNDDGATALKLADDNHHHLVSVELRKHGATW